MKTSRAKKHQVISSKRWITYKTSLKLMTLCDLAKFMYCCIDLASTPFKPGIESLAAWAVGGEKMALSRFLK